MTDVPIPGWHWQWIEQAPGPDGTHAAKQTWHPPGAGWVPVPATLRKADREKLRVDGEVVRESTQQEDDDLAAYQAAEAAAGQVNADYSNMKTLGLERIFLLELKAALEDDAGEHPATLGKVDARLSTINGTLGPLVSGAP